MFAGEAGPDSMSGIFYLQPVPDSCARPLTGVTHPWRDIATSRPYLWTTVHLSHFDARGPAFNSDALKTVPSRSQNYALHVHIDLGHVQSYKDLSEVEKILLVIPQQLVRCWRLTVFSDEGHCLKLLWPRRFIVIVHLY